MTPDSELLGQYARMNSENAFAELVRRHVNLVYSAALRQVNGDAHLAQDVAQTVFADLARKAGSLSNCGTLTGWLYTSTHFAAAKVVRTESRRREREEKFMREPIEGSAPDPGWEKLRPLLDAAMHELKDADREAILLRYFEDRPFAEVGTKLGLNENAARMRVDRALEKLRDIFTRRGVTTTAAFASVISANAVQTAPPVLAAMLTTASIATVGTGTFTLLKIMTATKIQLGISALVVAAATTALVVQHQAQNRLRAENESLAQQNTQLQADNAGLTARTTPPGDSKQLSDENFRELLRLRNEVGLLRQDTNELGKLREDNQRLKTAQQEAAPSQLAIIDAEAQQQAATIQKMNNAKQGLLAFIMFASDNQNQYPTNFSQTSSYLNDDNLITQIETNFDLTFQGSAKSIEKPGETIVLREKQPWQALNGQWMKAYGFADGHVEIHAEPTGDFNDWENQRIIPPPTQ